jgi:hypothetical protein
VKARIGPVPFFLAWFSVTSFGGCIIVDASSNSNPPVVPPFLVGTTGAGAVSDNVSPAPPEAGAISSLLGAECAMDDDCGGVLRCLSAASDDPIFGGGPAGGFCTKACDTNDDCPGSSSTCLKNSANESGRCTLSCSIGDSDGDALATLDQELEPSKCRGRADLRCDKIKNVGTVCLPTCGSDAQCGAGRFCDPRLAVCVDEPSTGLPTGAACELNASPATCAGSCVPFLDATITTCSTPCVLGLLDDAAPGATSNCGGIKNGLCAFHPPENGPGDLGYCSPSCAAQSDCQGNPSFWCFRVPAFAEASGGKGYCFSATRCATQGDCDLLQQGAYVCTATAKGSFCLDPTFPLDSGGTPTP